MVATCMLPHDVSMYLLCLGILLELKHVNLDPVEQIHDRKVVVVVVFAVVVVVIICYIFLVLSCVEQTLISTLT